jgi:uncharacterized protein HemX
MESFSLISVVAAVLGSGGIGYWFWRQEVARLTRRLDARVLAEEQVRNDLISEFRREIEELKIEVKGCEEKRVKLELEVVQLVREIERLSKVV